MVFGGEKGSEEVHGMDLATDPYLVDADGEADEDDDVITPVLRKAARAVREGSES